MTPASSATANAVKKSSRNRRRASKELQHIVRTTSSPASDALS
eukprot:CAMPEP_0174902962 /NCGR_PEP_ID=MMETSP0167-20121228/41247_1 /TAXON_ID=38298 /ORGANISM="Rhodella maculata, Strain CCMP736" /LENGTH=42 /DNA_ID= /DNA_START= /DNA_END= /DNA_ORIENTATION=